MNENSQDIIENLKMVAPEDPWALTRTVLVIAVPLLIAAFVVWRLHRKGRLPFFQHQPVPPEKTALERLAAIRHFIGEGLVREFVQESSDILRQYIEARFGLRAPHLSTEEFLYEAEQNPQLDSGRRSRLAEFLFCCDKVKFALGGLDSAQMETLYDTAVNFVKQTTGAPKS